MKPIESAGKNTMLVRWLLTWLFAFGCTLPALAQNGERYIDDSLKVPLRSSGSTESSTVHQGLPRGTAVTLIEEDAQFGWSLVRTRDGLQGWLPSRYLRREPGARYEILAALRALGQPDDGSVSLAAAVEQVRKDREAAEAARAALQAEMLELRQLSSSAATLDQNNRALSESVQMLKNRISVLEAENARLRDESWQKWFLMGVWATGIGGFLSVLLPRIIPRRRRRSEWA